MFTQSQFKPAWWLRNPHLQTIISKWFRRNVTVESIVETVELPDGDFIDVAWTERPTENDNRPIVVILHGLEGSIDSHYAKGMLNAVRNKGWIAVLMHFRACSGRPNRQASSYHSSDTRDIHYFSEQIRAQYPNHPLAILGFSLGGNVLAHYLAKHPDNPYFAASIICAPLHLASCSEKIGRGVSKVYQKFLLDKLKRSAREKIKLHLLNHISLKQLKAFKTLREFDQLVTAPLNGFADVDDYYHQASSRDILENIKQPCLITHSCDDPMISHKNTIAINYLPDNICFEVSHYGGHVGYVHGYNPFRPKFWLEKRVPDFFEQFLPQEKPSS